MTFDNVVDEHAARLYRLAYLYLHDRPAAEDTVQEAFLKFWREASRVENPGAWLSRVVRNRCLNELRRRGREQLTDPQDLATEDQPAWDGQAAEGLQMTAALLRLPVVYREVLVWRYYLDFSGDDLAAHLGLTPSGLRTRLARARQALARLLKEEEV